MMTHAQLKATKLNILEKKLAEVTEKLVQKIANKNGIPVQIQQENTQISGISNELAVEALFNLNMIMSDFVENMAEIGREHDKIKKYVPNIKGFTTRLLQPQKEKHCRECLKGIIEVHGETIKPLMSPIAVWLMFMISTASEQVAENTSKNLKQPITQ
jgi:hypothetical protein